MAPTSIKLHYFDARGRAEVSRLILAAAGQDYEDVRYTKDTWPAEKPNMPFLQVPVLEVDGKRFGQSAAIATYLAREFGFYGSTNLEGLEIDQIVHLVLDFISATIKAFYEPDEDKKAELLKNLKEVEGPKYLGFFEKQLKESGTGYFVGSSLTLADFIVYDIVDAYSSRGAISTDGFPLLQGLHEKVESQDKIKAYLATRKPTPS